MLDHLQPIPTAKNTCLFTDFKTASVNMQAGARTYGEHARRRRRSTRADAARRASEGMPPVAVTSHSHRRDQAAVIRHLNSRDQAAVIRHP